MYKEDLKKLLDAEGVTVDGVEVALERPVEHQVIEPYGVSSNYAYTEQPMRVVVTMSVTQASAVYLSEVFAKTNRDNRVRRENAHHIEMLNILSR